MQREREHCPYPLGQGGGRERGPLSNSEDQIWFQYGASRSVGRDAWPLTQGELQVIHRTPTPVGDGDSTPVLPITDDRDTSTGHRQHVDAQDQEPIEHKQTVNVGQDLDDLSQAVRIHTSHDRERSPPRLIVADHLATAHCQPPRSDRTTSTCGGPERMNDQPYPQCDALQAGPPQCHVIPGTGPAGPRQWDSLTPG